MWRANMRSLPRISSTLPSSVTMTPLSQSCSQPRGCCTPSSASCNSSRQALDTDLVNTEYAGVSRAVDTPEALSLLSTPAPAAACQGSASTPAQPGAAPTAQALMPDLSSTTQTIPLNRPPVRRVASNITAFVSSRLFRQNRGAATPPPTTALHPPPPFNPTATAPLMPSTTTVAISSSGIIPSTPDALPSLNAAATAAAEAAASAIVAAPPAAPNRFVTTTNTALFLEGPALPAPPGPRNPSNHPTLSLIEERQRCGSKPGSRSDGFKLGLVVEGGGMRGIVSGAMLMALHSMGLRDVFDAVYGASAGAINGTFFLTGQGRGLDIYIDDLTGNEFLDFAGLLRGHPIMNLDYLIDHVMCKVKPLDFQGVLDSPIPLKTVASSLDSLQPVILDNYTSVDDLKECLKASANVPEFAGPPRLVRGQRLVDAAVFEPVPVQSAMRDGCTHLLVLCTRPAVVQSAWSRSINKTVVTAIKHTMLNPPYMREAWRVDDYSLQVLADDRLVSALHTCPHEYAEQVGGYVLPIYPNSTAGCHPVCKDKATLARGKAQGVAAVAAMFQHLAASGIVDVGSLQQGFSAGSTLLQGPGMVARSA